MTKEQAIEMLNSIIKVHNNFLKECNEEKINELEIEAIETVLNLLKEKDAEIEKNKRLFSIQEKRKLHLLQNKDREIEKKDKIIDLIFDYMLNDVICEADLDFIYEELYNVCGESRDWCRGNEEEKKMLKQYFERKVEADGIKK